MKKTLQRLTTSSILTVASTLTFGLAEPLAPVTPDLLANRVLAAELALSASDIYEQAVESVVTIYTLDENYALAERFGSGFVVRSDGLIVTNSHVVRESITSVVVVFSDGSKSMAEVIGYDRQGRDLAALQLVGDYNLPILTLATQGMPRIGETVYAIGAPRGIANTMTSGIVGNVAANQTEILHNAAINGGNSGGPLIDTQGHVIGMNAWIFQAAVETVSGEVIGEVDGYSGMSFAIAANQITDFIADLESGVALTPAQLARRIVQN
ncbi:MAG: trypsin-like serine protease [Leptolyngbya sp. SIO3F4]|nr:trypsin-like serine protease [Leptolyngbya sp. SIO3F4]